MRRAARLAALLLAGPVLFGPAPAWPHGTGWRLTAEAAVVVELYYADGEPMPFADVKVFAPGDDAVPVLHARADARGRAAFVPDRDGIWTLAATDGDGHAVRAPVPVTRGTPGEPAARSSLELRVLLIGSLLANVALALAGWKLLSARRARSRPEHAGAARA